MLYTKETNYKQLRDGYDKGDKFYLDLSFLDTAINILANEVTPIKGENGLYSASLTLSSIDNDNIKHLILALYEIPRGKLVPPSVRMLDITRLASATPLPLAAFKHLHGINYEEWDKDDEMIHYMLGKFLKPLLDIRPIQHLYARKYPQGGLPRAEDVIAYRDICKFGPLLYKSLPKITLGKDGNNPFFTKSSSYIPATIVRMLMQLWIFHGSVRDTTGMQILDPFNWDNIPEAVDQPIVEEEKEEVLPEDKDPLILPF